MGPPNWGEVRRGTPKFGEIGTSKPRGEGQARALGGELDPKMGRGEFWIRRGRADQKRTKKIDWPQNQICQIPPNYRWVFNSLDKIEFSPKLFGGCTANLSLVPPK